MYLTNPADNMCLPGERRGLCVKIHRTKAGESALCARRAVSIQSVAARSGERVRPGSGSGSGPGPRSPRRLRAPQLQPAPFRTSPHLQRSLGSCFLGPRQLCHFFRTPSRAAPATVTKETSNATRDSSRVYGGREGAESSESDRGSGGPECGGVEIGAVGW